MFQFNLIDIFKAKFIGNDEDFIIDEKRNLIISKNDFVKKIVGTKNQLSSRVGEESRVFCEITNSSDDVVVYFACQIANLIFVPFSSDMLGLNDYLDLISPDLILFKNFISIFKGKNAVEMDKCVRTEERVGDSDLFIKKGKISDMFMTSGTTGKPKSIEMSFESRVYSTHYNCVELKHTEDDVHYCVLPMLHTAAWAYHILPSVFTASKLVISDKFHLSIFWESIRKYNITFVQLVPTILSILLKGKRDSEMKNHLKFIGCGSSILTVKLKREFEQSFKVKIINQYGLSEICSTHTSRLDDDEDNYSSANAGYPIFGVETIIVNDKNIICKENEKGEIRVKGPTIMKGYYKTEESDCIDENGFFKTGDIGFFDYKNRLYIVDRLKDIIIKGGVNIIPSEIEDAILTDNDIEDICVFSVEDEIYGEDIFVAAVNDKEIKLNLEMLPTFKRPKRIFYIEKMPVGFSGKKLRRILREKMQRGELNEFIG
jgi:long-chain acyl-CoA synthetase